MEKVILVKGEQSNWYEQAIFIVKQNVPQNKIPVDFVNEAEKIIERYMLRTGMKAGERAPSPRQEPNKTKQRPVTVKKRNWFDIFLNAVMLTGCVMLAVALAYHWFL